MDKSLQHNGSTLTTVAPNNYKYSTAHSNVAETHSLISHARLTHHDSHSKPTQLHPSFVQSDINSNFTINSPADLSNSTQTEESINLKFIPPQFQRPFARSRSYQHLQPLPPTSRNRVQSFPINKAATTKNRQFSPIKVARPQFSTRQPPDLHNPQQTTDAYSTEAELYTDYSGFFPTVSTANSVQESNNSAANIQSSQQMTANSFHPHIDPSLAKATQPITKQSFHMATNNNNHDSNQPHNKQMASPISIASYKTANRITPTHSLSSAETNLSNLELDVTLANSTFNDDDSSSTDSDSIIGGNKPSRNPQQNTIDTIERILQQHRDYSIILEDFAPIVEQKLHPERQQHDNNTVIQLALDRRLLLKNLDYAQHQHPVNFGILKQIQDKTNLCLAEFLKSKLQYYLKDVREQLRYHYFTIQENLQAPEHAAFIKDYHAFLQDLQTAKNNLSYLKKCYKYGNSLDPKTGEDYLASMVATTAYDVCELHKWKRRLNPYLEQQVSWPKKEEQGTNYWLKNQPDRADAIRGLVEVYEAANYDHCHQRNILDVAHQLNQQMQFRHKLFPTMTKSTIVPKRPHWWNFSKRQPSEATEQPAKPSLWHRCGNFVRKLFCLPSKPYTPPKTYKYVKSHEVSGSLLQPELIHKLLLMSGIIGTQRHQINETPYDLTAVTKLALPTLNWLQQFTPHYQHDPELTEQLYTAQSKPRLHLVNALDFTRIANSLIPNLHMTPLEFRAYQQEYGGEQAIANQPYFHVPIPKTAQPAVAAVTSLDRHAARASATSNQHTHQQPQTPLEQIARKVSLSSVERNSSSNAISLQASPQHSAIRSLASGTSPSISHQLSSRLYSSPQHYLSHQSGNSSPLKIHTREALPLI